MNLHFRNNPCSSAMKLVRSISMGLTLVALAACSQDPANVEYKGGQFFGREHEAPLNSPNAETFAPDSPRYKEGYAHPAEPAQVPNVVSAELPPPAVASNDIAPLGSPTPPPPAPMNSPAPAAPAIEAVAPAPLPAATAAAPVADDAAPTEHFIFPMAGGKIISHFGAKSDGHANDGINIAADEGEPIWAAAQGTVVYAGNELKGYGNMVILRHEGGWMTAYAHARSLSVKKGDTVKQGALVGYVGSTGGVKVPQLHFVLRNGKTPVDPEKYLSAGNTAKAQ